MRQLTGGDQSKPIVAMDFNSESHQGHNLDLHLVALGYTEVYWYRAGREASQVAGLRTLIWSCRTGGENNALVA